MTKIIDSNEWQDLKKHFDDIKNVQMRDLFKDDKQRFEKFHLALDDFLFDFSKNRINDKTLGLLNKLAIKADVEGWRAKQFSGEKINGFTAHSGCFDIDEQQNMMLNYTLQGRYTEISRNGDVISEYINQVGENNTYWTKCPQYLSKDQIELIKNRRCK